MGSQNRILWLLVLIASTLLVSSGVIATHTDSVGSEPPAPMHVR